MTSTVDIRHNTIRNIVGDAMVVTKRNLLKYPRVPALLAFSTIQPVMFVLLFVFVFGGAIQIPGTSYVDFLIPGIMVQTSLFGSTQTGIGIATDMNLGMVDRFRSLPMARSAVLVGRTLSDSVRNLFVVLLMVVVGSLVGFRFHAGFIPALGAVAIAVLFGFTFSWISANIGLWVKEVESAQAASFIWIFPLTFASSAFVPVATMPGWLQAWAKFNPVTNAVDAIRALVLGGPTATPVLRSVVWIIVLLLVFVPLAIRQYRRTA